jgi:hypothetical protein
MPSEVSDQSAFASDFDSIRSPLPALTEILENAEILPDLAETYEHALDPRVPKLRDRNTCLCTAHTRRRLSLPGHSVLPLHDPALIKDPEVETQLRDKPRGYWDDPERVPHRGHHYIPPSQPRKEPGTLEEYIRRELDYSDSIWRVMTVDECEARWGPRWREDCKAAIRRRQLRDHEPLSNEDLDNELDGYPGGLLKHERPLGIDQDHPVAAEGRVGDSREMSWLRNGSMR